MANLTPNHHTTWSEGYGDQTPWPLLAQAHERYTVVQVSKRRYQVAHSTSRGTANAGFYTPGLTGFFKNISYRVITQPLSYQEAMNVLGWLLAREVGKVETLPRNVQEILDQGPEFS